MGIDRSTIAKSPSGRLRVQMASNRLVAMIVIAVMCVALADEAFEWRKDAWSCSSTSPHREACVGEIGGAGIAAERALKLLSDELGESATQKASISGYLFGRRRRRRNRSTRRKKRQRRTRRKSRKSKKRQRRTRRKSRKSKKRQRRRRRKSRKSKKRQRRRRRKSRKS